MTIKINVNSWVRSHIATYDLAQLFISGSEYFLEVYIYSIYFYP